MSRRPPDPSMKGGRDKPDFSRETSPSQVNLSSNPSFDNRDETDMTSPADPDSSSFDTYESGEEAVAEIPEEKYSSNPATASIARQRETNRKVDRMLDAVYGESWARNFLLLVLTAGPLTFIGLQLGYYVGYGQWAPTKSVIYFIVFALIAGLGSLVFRIYEKIQADQEQESARNHFNTSMDILPDILRVTQNLRMMQETDPYNRAVDSSLIILKNSHATIEGLEDAVHQMTNSATLASGMRRIAIYRRHGLTVTVNDIVAEIAEEAGQVVEKMRSFSPVVAQWLEQRLMGRAPTLKEGIPRSEGFLERLLAWMGSDNDDLLRQADIEEFFVLAYELMCGREIPLLMLGVQGRNELGDALNQLNKARNDYRVAVASRFNRLKAIARYLNAMEDTEIQISREEMNANRLLDRVHEGISYFCDHINSQINEIKKMGGKPQHFSSDFHHLRSRVKHNAEDLGHVLDLYLELQEAHSRALRAELELEKSLQKWNRQSYAKAGETIKFKGIGAKRGLTITETYIRLRDYEKVQLANKIAMPLKMFFEKYKAIIFNTNVSLTSAYFEDCNEDLKRLTIEVFNALDQHVYLTRAERQRAIEYSNAPNYGSLEIGLSRQQKLSWGMIIAGDVEDDLSRMAERLFRAMITQYGVEVDDHMIQLLVERYGAREAVLKNIKENADGEISMPELSPPEKLAQKPILQPSWQQILSRALNI